MYFRNQLFFLALLIVILTLSSSIATFSKDSSVDPQELLDEGKRLCNQGSYEEALEYFLKVLEVKKEAGDISGVCYVLNYIGFSYSSLGNHKKALEYAFEELSLKKQIGDKSGIARSLNNIAFTYASLGKYEEALKYYMEELSLRKQIGNKGNIGLVFSDIAVIYEKLGNYEKALEYAQKDLSISKEIDDKAGTGNALYHAGLIYINIENYKKALEYFKGAEIIKEKMGDIKGAGNVYYYIGLIYSRFNDYGNAFDYFQKALKIQDQMKDLNGRADVLNKIGILYFNLGDFSKALEYYQEALQIKKQSGDKALAADILDDIVLAYAKLGKQDKALEYIQEMVKLREGVRDKTKLDKTYNNFAFIYIKIGYYQRAIEYMHKVLKIQKEVKNPVGQAAALNNIALIYYCSSDYKKALEYYQKALKILKISGDKSTMLNSFGGMALAYKGMKKYDRAIEFLIKSIDILESIRGKIKIEEHKVSFLEDKIFFYEELIQLLIKTGRIKDAWHYVERAKARTFLDMLGNQKINFRAKGAPELIEKEMELEDKINNVIAGMQKENDAGKKMLLKRQMDALQKEYEETIIKLKVSNPEYASLKSVQVSSLEEIQNLLEEDSVILEYFICKDKGYLFIIDKETFSACEIPFSEGELKEKITELRRRILTRAVCDKQIDELSRILLQPALSYIKKKKKIIVIPHSALHYLPFCLLRDSGGDYLVKRYQILTEPSASVWKLCLDKAEDKKMSLVAYALGTVKVSFLKEKTNLNEEISFLSSELVREGLSPLPATKEEVESIAVLFPESTILVGNQMTSEKVKETISEKSLIHFATHGLLDPIHPLFSGLVLCDRILTTAEIFSMDIDASMVVLSACDTAYGRISGGDEIIGISRAFMYAGTPVVVASLWSVSDESTASLMKSFYKKLIQGVSESRALEEAQLSLMDEYPHPYFWAPFIMIGDRRHGKQ